MTDEALEKKAEKYTKHVIDVNAFDWKIVREICLAYIAGHKDCAKARLNVTTISDYPVTELQLARAKELLKKVIKFTWGEGWNYSLNVKVEAEEFLKETEE